MITTIQVPLFIPVKTECGLSSWPARYLSPLSCIEEIATFNFSDVDGTQYCTREEYDTSFEWTAFKIATYILSIGILPLLAAILNLVIRCGTNYQYRNEAQATEPQPPQNLDPGRVQMPPVQRPPANRDGEQLTGPEIVERYFQQPNRSIEDAERLRRDLTATHQRDAEKQKRLFSQMNERLEQSRNTARERLAAQLPVPVEEQARQWADRQGLTGDARRVFDEAVARERATAAANIANMGTNVAAACPTNPIPPPPSQVAQAVEVSTAVLEPAHHELIGQLNSEILAINPHEDEAIEFDVIWAREMKKPREQIKKELNRRKILKESAKAISEALTPSQLSQAASDGSSLLDWSRVLRETLPLSPPPIDGAIEHLTRVYTEERNRLNALLSTRQIDRVAHERTINMLQDYARTFGCPESVFGD